MGILYLIDITPLPWYADVTAWAGVLVGGAVILKFVRYVGRALWAAVLSAPKIVDRLDVLNDLMDGKVLDRLELGQKRFDNVDFILADHASRLHELDDKHTPPPPFPLGGTGSGTGGAMMGGGV